MLLLLSYYFFNKPQHAEIVSNHPSIIDSGSLSHKAPINKQEIYSNKKNIHVGASIHNLAVNEKVNLNRSGHAGFDKKLIKNSFLSIDSASIAEKKRKFEISNDSLSTDFEKQEFKSTLQKNDFVKMVFLKQDSLLNNDSDSIKNIIQKNALYNCEPYSLAEVFTEQESKELGFALFVKDDSLESLTFSKAVLKKVEALAATKEIKINKHYSQNVASVTYNIKFGQNFSLEHIEKK